jgi:hypothetical protein
MLYRNPLEISYCMKYIMKIGNFYIGKNDKLTEAKFNFI